MGRIRNWRLTDGLLRGPETQAAAAAVEATGAEVSQGSRRRAQLVLGVSKQSVPGSNCGTNSTDQLY